MGNMWEGGRERDGMDPVEYWDSRFLEACDMGLGICDRRADGEVIRGARDGWFGFDVCGGPAGGEGAGDEYVDMIVVIEERKPKRRACVPKIELVSMSSVK